MRDSNRGFSDFRVLEARLTAVNLLACVCAIIDGLDNVYLNTFSATQLVDQQVPALIPLALRVENTRGR